MLYDISQGFLGDAVETESHFFWQQAAFFVMVEVDFDAVLPRNVLAMASDGGYQSDVVQDGGVQAVGQLMKVRVEFVDAVQKGFGEAADKMGGYPPKGRGSARAGRSPWPPCRARV